VRGVPEKLALIKANVGFLMQYQTNNRQRIPSPCSKRIPPGSLPRFCTGLTHAARPSDIGKLIANALGNHPLRRRSSHFSARVIATSKQPHRSAIFRALPVVQATAASRPACHLRKVFHNRRVADFEIISYRGSPTGACRYPGRNHDRASSPLARVHGHHAHLI